MHAARHQDIYALLAFFCALLACVTDLRTRRIPNALTASAAVFGLLLHLLLDHWSGFGSSALAGLAAALSLSVLYLVGGMGAGDIKLLAAVGCLNGIHSLGTVLVATVISGGVFALVLAVSKGRVKQTGRNVRLLIAHHVQNGALPHPDFSLSSAETIRIPYALPVATGCLLAAYWVTQGPSV